LKSKFNPESGKHQTNSVDSIPEDAAFHTLHCAQKAISSGIAYQVLIFAAPKIANAKHTCSKKEIFQIFKFEASAVFAVFVVFVLTWKEKIRNEIILQRIVCSSLFGYLKAG